MHKVIFDTDPGVDDAMALLFLAKHPAIDLVGVTTTFGNAPIDITTNNALYLKKEWGLTMPVAKGSGDKFNPDRATHPYPSFIHGDDGLGNIGVPDMSAEPLDPRPAHDFLIEMVRAHPGEITIVAVGRMTNLANALKADPEITSLVKEVVIMGGALDVPGNVSPAAEANIHGDPEAADVVMTAPWKVVLVPLDVTLKTVMTRTTLAELTERGGPELPLLNRLSQFYIDFYDGQFKDSMVVHDTCACVYVVAPEIFKTRPGVIRVLTEGIGEGKTLQKPDGMRFAPNAWDGLPSQLGCIDIDGDKALQIVLETLAL